MWLQDQQRLQVKPGTLHLQLRQAIMNHKVQKQNDVTMDKVKPQFFSRKQVWNAFKKT